MFKYVTSMNQKIYEEYGKKMLETFDRYWPDGEMWVYMEDPFPVSASQRIKFKSLNQIKDAEKYLNTVNALPAFRGEMYYKGAMQKNYRFNIATFAKKALAQCDAAQGHDGYLFWIDADVITEKHIPKAVLTEWMLGNFMIVMKRKDWHMCSSFIGWDCTHVFADEFFNHYYHLYMTGNVFTLNEWHDAFVLETAIYNMPGVKDIAEDYAGPGPYNVFDMVFDGYAKHLKGTLKYTRYHHLIEIVTLARPEVFIEIGTWNGDRAIQIHDVSPDTDYIGFDLFEDATEETDKQEKNVKPHYKVDDVKLKLKDAGITYFDLIKGDTKETLPKYIEGLKRNETLEESKADIVFIDGGHSVETIKSDLKYAKELIKPGGVIILDDYYSDMPKEELDKYGCQAVLQPGEFELLPIKDKVRGGGCVQLAVLKC